MQKLSVEVLEKCIQQNLTSAEINMLLYIARFQNDDGVVHGVYYKDVCDAIGLSYQGFYDCKKSLQNKGIIESEKANYYDWNIKIVNNSFIGKDNYGRGYVSVSSKMVKSKIFQKLRANAKIMALYLLREWQISFSKTRKKSYQILKDTFLKKFSGLGVSARMLRSYLTELTPFLSVYLENGRKYYITFKNDEIRNISTLSENDELREHEYIVSCRRNRIHNYTNKQKEDIFDVLKQYHVKLIKDLEFDLSKIIAKSLEIINQGILTKKNWKRQVNPSLVHKLIRQELQLEPVK